MFLPGQFTAYFDVARRAEVVGTSEVPNVYFAGEHLSRHHTWIAGALESALYSVEQMLGVEVSRLRSEEEGGAPTENEGNQMLSSTLKDVLDAVDETHVPPATLTMEIITTANEVVGLEVKA